MNRVECPHVWLYHVWHNTRHVHSMGGITQDANIPHYWKCDPHKLVMKIVLLLTCEILPRVSTHGKVKLIIEQYYMWTSYVFQSTWKKNWLGLKMSLDYLVWNSYTTKELNIGYCTKFWLYTFVENWGILLNSQACNRKWLCNILKVIVNSVEPEIWAITD